MVLFVLNSLPMVLFTYLQSICTDLISTTGPGTNLCKILTLVLPGSSIGSAPFFPCHRKPTFWSFSFFFFFLTKRFIFWLVHLNIYERKNDEQGIYKEMNSFFTLFWKENIYKTLDFTEKICIYLLLFWYLKTWEYLHFPNWKRLI